jgi:hypothetical protein
MPQIVEVNGENVEFPDGMSDDQIAAAIQASSAPQGADTPQLTPEQIQQKLPTDLPVNMGAMPNGAPLPYGVDPKMIQQMNADNSQTNQRNQGIRNNPSMMDKIAAADKQGWLESMARGAGNTINELGSGIEDLADKHLPSAISDILAYRPFGENGLTPEQRIARRQGEMEKSNEDQLVRTIANPPSTIIGSMLPYFGTGRGIEMGIDAVAKTVSPITRQLVQKSLTNAGRLEGQGSGIANSIGQAANTTARRMDSVPKIPNDFQRRVAYGFKAPVIGAVEGGANYNQTMGEGALMSTAGLAAGLFGPARMLDRVENVRDGYTKQLVKEMDDKGFSLTPGVRTGNRQMQKEEAGISNSDVLGDHFYQTVTRPNQRKMTEMAGEAIGMNMRGRDNFSPQELQKHMDDLSSQYGQLEANTTGVLTRAHVKQMADALRELKPTPNRNTTTLDKARYDQVKSVIQQIQAETNQVSRAGMPSVRTFDGTKYQQLRQRIQDEASQAFMKGDSRLGNQLKKVQSALDSSLEQGMGKATASQWKDLNERYAMTNLLARKALTPTGAVDPTRITSTVMRDDEALRTLTNRGGRIQNFQKIAKYNDILSNVEGGSLTGLGKADYTADRSLTKLPMRYKIAPYARLESNYRLGMLPLFKPDRGFGPTASLQTGRAFAQTEPADKLYESGKMGVEELLKMIRGE